MDPRPISTAPEDDATLDPIRECPKPDLPDSMPLWRLYWFALGTLGVYLPVWVYRTARRAWGGRPGSDAPLWWAFGSVAPPVCAALLIEFERRARAEMKKAGATGVPVFLYFSFLLIINYSPLAEFIPALLFLVPLPFLMLQSMINRIHALQSAPSSPTSRQVHPVEWVAASLGTTVLAIIVWLYSPAFMQLFAIHYDAGTTIASVSGQFTVTLPSDDWRVVSAGTIADQDSDLELIGPGVGSWVVAYNFDRRQVGFESVIDGRRWECTGSGQLASFKESRQFLDGPDFIPISIAEYEVHHGLQGTTHYVVLTAQLEDRVIEVIGHSVEPELFLNEVRDLARSFLPAAGGERS